MQNRPQINTAIEGSCLFGRPAGPGICTYNLIKYLLMVEKVDRFVIWNSHPPLFRRDNIDFKQHNLTRNNPLIPSFLSPRIDVYHDACCALQGTPARSARILTVHDISPLVVPETCHDLTKKLFEANIRTALAGSSAVIVPSENTRNDLIKHLKVGASKISVIYEGAEEEFTPRTKYQIGLIKSRYSIKRPYVFFFGTLDERKNISRLLEAYAKLKYESPPDLVIAGEVKWLKEPLAKTIKRLGIENSVKYLGYVPRKDLPPLLSGAELLIWPSLYEGFGLPVLEAMSCGTPVVSSDVSSIPEICGDAGILVDPYDTDRIADAVKKVLSSIELQTALSQKGLERAKRFSLKNMAAKTLELYRKVARD